jgi:hypothetical protein
VAGYQVWCHGISFLTLMVVVEDQVSQVWSFRSCFARSILDFSDGRHEEYCPRNICLICYIFDNGNSYSWLASDIDKAVRLLFLGILVWILLPMVIDYFNGYACARSLGIAAQIKIMGESLLVFLGLWFDIYLQLASGK